MWIVDGGDTGNVAPSTWYYDSVPVAVPAPGGDTVVAGRVLHSPQQGSLCVKCTGTGSEKLGADD